MEEISNGRLRLRVRLVVNLDQLLHRNVSVDLRSGKSRVAEKFLNVPQVSAAVEQVGGE